MQGSDGQILQLHIASIISFWDRCEHFSAIHLLLNIVTLLWNKMQKEEGGSEGATEEEQGSRRDHPHHPKSSVRESVHPFVFGVVRLTCPSGCSIPTPKKDRSLNKSDDALLLEWKL